MDAPDDRDVKLYRDSADLLAQINVDLPRLLWRSSGSISEKVPRAWVANAHLYKILPLFEPFQEWPQLLDPHLGTFVHALTDAFLTYLNKFPSSYTIAKSTRIPSSPLPTVVCKLLYTLCKIRGEKVISIFFRNDPQLLQPMLEAFIGWENTPFTSAQFGMSNMSSTRTWEERYVMLLWLSHLLLTPFNLDSVASEDVAMSSGKTNLDDISILELPPIAMSLLKTSMKYVRVPGKEREAATALLVRLCLRPDMQKAGLLESLIGWALSLIRPRSVDGSLDTYEHLGALSFLSGLLRSAQINDVKPFLSSIFGTVHDAATEMSGNPTHMIASASARKLAVKILRSALVISITSAEDSNTALQTSQLTEMLEDSIEYLLKCLADKDTPVRFAASKALSIVALKLDSAFAASIVEAVLDSLEENLLFEDPIDGKLIAATELDTKKVEGLKRILSGVDPLLWQGLMLTLAQLLYRRSPPPDMLSHILTCLVSGLEFEQRSSTGSSSGTGVRDAACFGMWALARKYKTTEMPFLHKSKADRGQELPSTLQLLANALVLSGCTDPSGNIRRGSSAALQELIGRHPDTVHEGILVVQAVDYHAVALRSRAMIDVSVTAARLHPIYEAGLVDTLRGWRGIGSPDTDSRRNAASAIAKVSTVSGPAGLDATMHLLMEDLDKMSAKHVEVQHGILLSLACVAESYLDVFTDMRDTAATDKTAKSLIQRMLNHLSRLSRMSEYVNIESLRLSRLRPHLLAEACSELIIALSEAYMMCKSHHLSSTSDFTNNWQRRADYMALVLGLCVEREEPVVVRAASRAASTFLATIPSQKRISTMTGWLGTTPAMAAKATTNRDTFLNASQARTGAIAAYGAAFHQVPVRERGRLHHLLCILASSENPVETREAALRGLASGVLPFMDLDDSCICEVIAVGLKDYTTDSRGDVGSLIRLEAIRCVQVLFKRVGLTAQAQAQASVLLPHITRLAAEKVDKVRLQAWICLQTYSKQDMETEAGTKHIGDVSSLTYYQYIASFLEDDHVRFSTLQGLATAASAGSDTIIRASRLALTSHLSITTNPSIYSSIFTDLLRIVAQNQKEDRWLIPALELLGFLFIQRQLALPVCDLQKLFDLTQKTLYRSKSIPKLEAAIKVYAGLLVSIEQRGRLSDGLKNDTLKKLTSMLLHSYPKIRNAAADLLFLHSPLDTTKLTKQDWWAPPKDLKPIVDEMRQDWALQIEPKRTVPGME